MSDPVAEATQDLAAAALEASAKAGAVADQMIEQVNSQGSINPALFAQGQQAGQALATLAQGSDAPQEAGGALMGEPTGSDSLTPSTPTSDAPSRESLIARLHAAVDELESKIAAGVHVFAHEVAALRDHIARVL